MATKQNPGEYDCYAHAAPDEPLFTLVAKDPLAPILVRIWVLLRECRPDSAIMKQIIYARASLKRAKKQPIKPQKAVEAQQCAKDMETWYATNILTTQ